MNKLSREEQTQVIMALVEGNSISSTVRMIGVSKVTILKLLKQLGVACAEYQDHTLRNLKCRKVQVDEIWQFVYAKEKNVPLGGHFKTGHRWAGQNRPMGGRPGLSCFTLPAPLLASRFSFASFAGRISADVHGEEGGRAWR